MSRKYPNKNVRLELILAGRDLEAGDLARAAAHVSNVLISAPALPEVHEMLARLAAHPRGGRGLFPMTSSAGRSQGCRRFSAASGAPRRRR